MNDPVGWIALAASALSLGTAIWARHGIKADRARVDAAQARLRAALADAPSELQP